jgi:curved DNA-binding protein CbpA
MEKITYPDHYRVLCIGRNASNNEIRKAYLAHQKMYHPDKNPENQEEATEKTKRINQAYEVLMNTAKRKAYDAVLDETERLEKVKRQEQNAKRKADEQKKRDEEMRRKNAPRWTNKPPDSSFKNTNAHNPSGMSPYAAGAIFIGVIGLIILAATLNDDDE